MKYDKYGILKTYKNIPLNSKILTDDGYWAGSPPRWVTFKYGWECSIGQTFKSIVSDTSSYYRNENYRRKIKFKA